MLRPPAEGQGAPLGRYTLGQYPCHGVLGDSQYFCLADEGSLRNEYMCGDVGSNGKGSENSCHMS